MAAQSTGNGTTVPSQEPESVNWDEMQVRASLAKLEQLQGQIDTLRSVIPSITAAAAARNPSKSAYFANFQKVAVSGSWQVNEFAKDWLSPETQKLFERARKSKADEPNLSKAAGVPKYGWLENKDQEF